MDTKNTIWHRMIKSIFSIFSTISLTILRQSESYIYATAKYIYYLSLPVTSLLTILSTGLLRILLMLTTLWLAIATGQLLQNQYQKEAQLAKEKKQQRSQSQQPENSFIGNIVRVIFSCILQGLVQSLIILSLIISFLFALITLLTAGWVSLLFMLVSIFLAFLAGSFYRSMLKIAEKLDK